MNETVAERRERAVAEAVSRITAIQQARGVNRESLNDMREVLYELASQDGLFPRSDFPPPANGEMNIRYRLSAGDDQSPTLYLNSIMPGKLTEPHNHTTWAIVVAVQGDELNRFYERTDGGSGRGEATLELEREVVVTPGVGVTMMPDDIHAIAVTGDEATLHLHMYGRALETLTERVGYDLEAGTCDYYRVQGQTANQPRSDD